MIGTAVDGLKWHSESSTDNTSLVVQMEQSLRCVCVYGGTFEIHDHWKVKIGFLLNFIHQVNWQQTKKE